MPCTTIAGKLLGAAAIFTVCLVAGHSAGWAAAPERPFEEKCIVLIGSNTLVPLAQRLAEEWMRLHPDSVVSVIGGGSERGIKAVRDGAARIGLVSSPTHHIEAGQQQGTPLAIHRISQDAVIPVAHPSNPVRDLNLGQLRRIFSGDIRNWKDVGGTDAPIEVLTHDGATGTYEAWKERVLGENRVVLPEAEVTGTDAMLLAIAARPHAIGYVAYVSLNPTVRALSVNGIAPTQANIASETFPVTRSLKFVTAAQTDESTRLFVDFCLDPEGGGRIQKELGMIPYKRSATRVTNSVNKG